MTHREPDAHDETIKHYRLHCADFSVDVRLLGINGRWIASADMVDGGRSLGRATDPLTALLEALEPFDGVVDHLIAAWPNEIY